MTPTPSAPVQPKAPPASDEVRRGVSKVQRAKDPFSQIFDQKMSQKVEKRGVEPEVEKGRVEPEDMDDKKAASQARRKAESAAAGDQAGTDMMSSQLGMLLVAPLPEIGLVKINADISGSRFNSDLSGGNVEVSSPSANGTALVKPELAALVKPELAALAKVETLSQAAAVVPVKEGEVAKLGPTDFSKEFPLSELPVKLGKPALLEEAGEMDVDSTAGRVDPGQFMAKKESSAPLLVSKEELATHETATDSASGESSKPNWMLESQQGRNRQGQEAGNHRSGNDGMEAAKSVGDMKFWADKGLESTIEPAFPADHGYSLPEQAHRAQVEPIALRAGSVEPSSVVASGTVQGVLGGEGRVDSSASAQLPRELHPVLEEMWDTVTNFQIRNATRLVVQIRPDDATRLKLVVQQNKGCVEIQAEIQRGDSRVLSAGWSELQATLAEKGVVLRPLEVSPIFQSISQNPANQLLNEGGRNGGSAYESEVEPLDWDDQAVTRPVTIPAGRFQSAPTMSGVWERWA